MVVVAVVVQEPTPRDFKSESVRIQLQRLQYRHGLQEDGTGSQVCRRLETGIWDCLPEHASLRSSKPENQCPESALEQRGQHTEHHSIASFINLSIHPFIMHASIHSFIHHRPCHKPFYKPDNKLSIKRSLTILTHHSTNPSPNPSKSQKPFCTTVL